MRILWLSPWLRPPARVAAENLQRLGAEVMLVTADLHPESDQARQYETVLLGRPIPTADWLRVFAAYRDAKRFHPDVVVTELLRDPRWRIFAKLAPRVRLVHDARPHDETHVAPWWNRFFFNRWDAGADATIVFSNYVADSLRAAGTAGARLYVAPLIGDLDPSLVPDFVPAERRKNFILMGRQKPYKNHDVVFAAWEAHTRGTAWRGDELVVLGEGEIPGPLPTHARWDRRPFVYRQVVDELARSKGSIVHSRSASQSGVQLLSMQLGVPTLVSTAGALPEYQPPGLSVTGIDDIDGLSRALDVLANAGEAELQGKTALEHYGKHYDSAVVARRLLEIFHDVVDEPKQR
jgi:glycosyltransferase involved in cell wall biosynthesis